MNKIQLELPMGRKFQMLLMKSMLFMESIWNFPLRGIDPHLGDQQKLIAIKNTDPRSKKLIRDDTIKKKRSAIKNNDLRRRDQIKRSAIKIN